MHIVEATGDPLLIGWVGDYKHLFMDIMSMGLVRLKAVNGRDNYETGTSKIQSSPTITMLME